MPSKKSPAPGKYYSPEAVKSIVLTAVGYALETYSQECQPLLQSLDLNADHVLLLIRQVERWPAKDLIEELQENSPELLQAQDLQMVDPPKVLEAFLRAVLDDVVWDS